jgi:hypothetical protein
MIRRSFGRWMASAALAMATACNADQEPAGIGGGGAAGAGGSGGAAGSAGGLGDASLAEASLAEGSLTDRPSGEGGQAASFALFAGSDFADEMVKVTAVDWASRTIAGSAVVSASFADALPFASHGRAFLLERSGSKLLSMDPTRPWMSTSTIDLSGADDSGRGTDPVVVVNTAGKAYVPLYFKNSVAVVDLETKNVTGTIDLSSFVDRSDPDGLTDVWDGAYDDSTHRAYFLLQRIAQDEIGIEPDRVPHCVGAPPLIIAVDTDTDHIIDLDVDGGHTAIALLGANPTALVADFGARRLLVVDAGCYEAPDGGLAEGGADAKAALVRQGRGIEAVDLTSTASSWRYRHSGPDRMSGLVWADTAHAFISTTDAAYESHWFAWDPSTTVLGAEITNFPKFAPRLIGAGVIAGIVPASADGGMLNALVSFDVVSGQTKTLVPDLFGDPKYDGEFNGWALVQ